VEGLSRRRLERLYRTIDRHRLLFGRGLCSDDTEHNVMVALSVCRAGDDVERFAAGLRSRLRWWLLALPAGVGSATARAILKLWLFLPQRWQGVYSAGNGAAMRAPLLGALFAERPAILRDMVRASTRLTHTDPKAECAALAVALAAGEAALMRLDPVVTLERLREELAAFGPDGEVLLALLERAGASARAGESSLAFAASLQLQEGVTGYAYHTVPVALHGCFAHPRNYARAVGGVIACGGDTDTVAAITGGIVGAAVGRAGLPPAWLDRLIEWPASVRWQHSLAAAAQRCVLGAPFQAPREHAWLVLLGRNLVFLAIVLAHGFRRLLPPW
jgi:ADP-ribosylglycohydrolase